MLVEKRLPALIRNKFSLFKNLNPKFGQRRGLRDPKARRAAEGGLLWNCEIRIAK